MGTFKSVLMSRPMRLARRVGLCAFYLYVGLLLGFILVIARSEIAGHAVTIAALRSDQPFSPFDRYLASNYQYAGQAGLRFAEMEWLAYPIYEGGPSTWFERRISEWGKPQAWDAILFWVAGWSTVGMLILAWLPVGLIRRNSGQLQGTQRAQMVAWLHATLTAQPMWSLRHAALLLVIGLTVAVASEFISIQRTAYSWRAFQAANGVGQIHEPSNWLGLLTPIDAAIVALLAMALPTLLVLPALRHAARQRAILDDGWCLHCGYSLASNDAATAKCSECGTTRDHSSSPRSYRKVFWPLLLTWLLLVLGTLLIPPLFA